MKLYDKYKILKEKNNSKKYLFKSGNFYIFLEEDAISLSEVTTLKLTSFGNIVKCGFPVNSLEKYMKIFMNIGLEVVVIERYQDIIEELESVDLNGLSKLELILIIERFMNAI